MNPELLFKTWVSADETNESEDELVIHVFFLTYDGTTAQVHNDFTLLSMESSAPRGRSISASFVSPRPPNAVDPYLAIIVRVIEHDNSSERARANDINSMLRVLQNMSPKPTESELMASVRTVMPDSSGADDDDLIGSKVIVFEGTSLLNLPQSSVDDFLIYSSQGKYKFIQNEVRAKKPEDRNGYSAFRVKKDTDARAFIRNTSNEELAMLTPKEANHLLEHLFSGATGDDDERAIVDLVAALPSSTVRTLATEHRRTVDAYDSEVDGAHWNELQPILARSLNTND